MCKSKIKILYIDTQMSGHHRTYMEALVTSSHDTYVLLPYGERRLLLPSDHVFYISSIQKEKLNYFSLLRQIKSIANEVHPDVIHFLYGDDLYRRFGINLDHLYSKAKVVVTCHQIRRSKLRDMSYRHIGRAASTLVVHTAFLQRELDKLGIHNVVHIEYPQFSNGLIIGQKKALAKLGINKYEGKVLLALGGTRYDKGLDILLEALSGISEPFHLIVAGEENDFNRTFIEKKIEPYKESVSLLLHFLSDEEFVFCLNAADIIVLPYRSSFDGASGPLGEGVWYYKEIVAPDYKSFGELISNNHLGQTFEREDAQALRATLKNALLSDWQPDETYLHYRATLDQAIFQKSYMDLYQKLVGK